MEEEDKEISVEQPVIQPPEEPKKKKNMLPAIIILIVLLAAVIGVAIFLIKNNSEKEGKQTEKTDEKLNYTIYLYRNNNEEFPQECIKKTSYCSVVVEEIKVANEDAKIVDMNNKNYLLIKDGDEYKIYDRNTKTTETTKFQTDRKYVKLAVIPYLDKEEVVVGIIYYDKKLDKAGNQIDTNAGFYNIEKETKLYEGKYDTISVESKGFLSAGKYGADEDDYYSYLLRADKEEVIIEEDDANCVTFRAKETKDSYFIIKYDGCTGGTVDTIYTSDKKELVKDVAFTNYDFKDDYVDIYDNKKVITYDTTGKKIKERNVNGTFLMISNNYIFYIEDNKVKVTDGDKFVKELSEWKKEYYFHWMISGYYYGEELEYEEKKQDGIYLVIGYTNEFEGKGFELYFNPEDQTTERFELEEIGGYAKPILYLYPEKETKVTVDFEHEDKLTTTYPKFKDSWTVTAKPNGDLYDTNGKYYYGLYWEENLNHFVDFHEGFYVTKENAIEFLEEKLTYIGLNERERNEFIMYWLPILEKNGKNLVYFELTEERDSYNKLEITPKPDSLLRVAIHVKKVNKKTNIKEQKLKTFNRTGFTAVEWGGVQYK